MSIDNKKVTILDVVNMDRHTRRAYGKRAGFKIPGIPVGVTATLRSDGTTVDMRRISKTATPDSVLNVKSF